MGHDLDTRTKRVGEDLPDVANEDRTVHALRPQLAATGETQQPPGYGGAPAGGVLDHAGKPADAVNVCGHRLDQAARSLNRLKNVVKVMRDAAGQLPECLQALRLRRTGPCLL